MNKKLSYSLVVLANIFAGTGIAMAAVTVPNPLGVNSFGDLLTKIAEGAGKLIVEISVIMIIVSGIMYLLSSGNPERMKLAKTTLTYSIIGTAIGLAASAIVATIKTILGA